MPIELLPCSLPSISVSESESDHSNANTDVGRMPESVSESERVEAAAEAWGAVDGPATGDGVRGGGRVPDRVRRPVVGRA